MISQLALSKMIHGHANKLREEAIMRFLAIVLLLVAMFGCDSGTRPAKPSVKAAREIRARLAKERATRIGKKEAAKIAKDRPARIAREARDAAAKTPDAAAVKKHMTPAQLALGDPVVNSVGMLLVPIPAGEFQFRESAYNLPKEPEYGEEGTAIPPLKG